MSNLPNYLPHPLSQYGCYKPQPDDEEVCQDALRDQAAWNLLYLVKQDEVDYWHLRPVFSPSQKDRRRGLLRSLAGERGVADLLVDNKLVRHHMLTKTPLEMVELLLPLNLWERHAIWQVETLRALGKTEEPDVDAETLEYWRNYPLKGLNQSRARLMGAKNGRKD